MSENLTQWLPSDIDGELARLWPEIQNNRALAYQSRKRAKEHYRQALAREDDRLSARRDAALQNAEKYEAKVAELEAEAAPYEAEFARRGGWNRYFLVTNANGHVHRGTDCSTCFYSTRYAWLVELADCDEAAMIEEWGEKACTVCFPDAPTNPLYHRPSRQDREAQAAREAEKAARAAEKAAKAERIAQREAKAEAKAAADAKAKAEGTYKPSPAERRDAAIAKISDAAIAKDWYAVVEIVNEAKALGKTERWQTALRQMEVIAAARAAFPCEPDGRYFQALINLGWANS